MAITFNCGHCGKSLTTADDKAGRKAKCPGCGEVVLVPASESASSEPMEDYEEVPADEGDALPPAPAKSRSGERTKTCPMCGEKNSPRADTCAACGEELNEETENSRSRKRQHTIIELGEVLSATWTIFKQNLWLLAGMALVCLTIGGVCYGAMFGVAFAFAASQQGQANQQQTELIINLISLPVGFIFAFGVAYLNSGVNLVLLALARGEDASLDMMFSGGKFLMRAFLIGLLYQFMTTIGAYCCIVPGILLSLMFWPYLYIIVDQDCPGIESLNKAREITNKNWASVFVLGIVASSVTTMGALTCLGLPFAMGFCWLMYAVAYCKMTNQRTAE